GRWYGVGAVQVPTEPLSAGRAKPRRQTDAFVANRNRNCLVFLFNPHPDRTTGPIWVSIFPRIRDKLIDDEPNKNRTIRGKPNCLGSVKLDFGRRDRRLQVADDLT